MSDDELISDEKRGAPNPSVGLVRAMRARIPLPESGLRLEKGGALPELDVAYECYGELAPARDNVIYICHALTGDAHAAGYHQPSDRKPGWWDAMIGPGKGLDTDRFHIICANILGGCMGTTGPSSIDPRTGKAYGATFPAITTGDIVRVQRMLLEHLGIKHLAAVIGGSFGGMQVLEWSMHHGDMLDRAICIASAMNLSAQALAFDIVGRHAILADPAWAGGDYYAGHAPLQGLAQARMIGHITYLSREFMKRKFGREKKAAIKPEQRFVTPFQVESYLDYQGTKFVNRFDANSYLHISEAMDNFDLTEAYANPADAFATAGNKTRFLVVALSSDWLFPPEQSLDITAALIRAERRVTHCLLQSPYGHDAFLVEVDRLAEVVRTFLSSPDTPSLPPPAPSQRKRVRNPKLPRAFDRSETDFNLIARMITQGSRVLDLGCGDGELLARLMRLRQVRSLGIDIDLDNLLLAVEQGIDVIQQDLDIGLEQIPDQSYDYAILSETLQVVRKPRLVLNEMLRVASEGLVAIPNLGNWYHRLRLGITGRMPMSSSLPFEWYDTPNIHLATLKDFEDLCRKDAIRIRERVCIPAGRLSRLLLACGLCNLGADRVLLRISR